MLLYTNACFLLMDRVGDKTIALLLLAAFRIRNKEVLIRVQTTALVVACMSSRGREENKHLKINFYIVLILTIFILGFNVIIITYIGIMY